MSEAEAQTGRKYPCEIALANGAAVTLRLMTAKDAEPVLEFARGLPEEDLLFLRTDVTDPEVVRQWVANIAAGQTLTVLAEMQGAVAGYASLHYNETTWQRHIGEIRVQVGPRSRSLGLGRALGAEIFALARGIGLRKLMARMTTDQAGARHTFERLGFQPEALLQDFVIDRSSRTRDLVIMTYDVTGLTDAVE